MSAAQIRLATEDRQALIVSTMLELAAHSSPAEITTADLAIAMGVTQGAVFRHFPSKEAIRGAVAESIAATLAEQMRGAAAGQARALDALVAVFRAHVAFVAAFPGAPRFIFYELQQPDDNPVKQRVRTLLKDYRAFVVQLLRRVKAQGDVDTELAEAPVATLFLGAVQGLVMQAMASGSMAEMKRQAEGVLAVLLAGLRGARA